MLPDGTLHEDAHADREYYFKDQANGYQRESSISLRRGCLAAGHQPKVVYGRAGGVDGQYPEVECVLEQENFVEVAAAGDLNRRSAAGAANPRLPEQGSLHRGGVRSHTRGGERRFPSNWLLAQIQVLRSLIA